MEQRTLGRTGYKVTRVALGTYRFTVDFGIARAQSLALLDRAMTLGINYMDTAPVYGSGESEELIGRVLQRHPAKHIHLSTKVGCFEHTIARSSGNEAYRSEDCIRRVVEHSLWLLRRDHLEMVFVHEPENEAWGWDEKTLEAPVLRVLQKLKVEKVIGAIGLGSNSVEFPGKLAETGRFDVIEIANGYTLLTQRIEDRILPAAAAHDIGIVAGGPFRDGMLAAAQHDKLAELKRAANWGGWVTAQSLERLDRLYRLSAEAGMAIHELSLRYILSNPAIHTVIPGAQSPAEVDANYQSGIRGCLPDDILDAIRKIQEATRE